ncbi:ebi (nucleomorph) [Hemiselmis andersenii]|uniref:Ebi n=2 Tax=Hemiselmis andersenii TaxID=464988 RepID=A9BL59_HEMAN|nr:ebi [Hemiselmis andersenii]ABW98242.1 ebi [Hemiselmis andersenii]|mmetsp:Transcript_20903/g.48302  ORF Transcript_20903/g.48302 Transcript_20903/m.48302 type:complete len:452 (+) Transcript_20903:454-1809(+)
MHHQIRVSEIDLAIFFYLQECGFIHSAYTFAQESRINFLKLEQKIFPPGLLISLIQRGIAYAQIELASPPLFRSNSRSPIENFLFSKNHLSENYFFKTKNEFNKKRGRNFFNNDFSIFSFFWHIRKTVMFFGTRDGKFYKWNIEPTKKIEKKKKISSQFFLSNKAFEKKDLISLDINLIGTLIVAGLNNGEIFFLTESGKILENFSIPESPPLELKFNENSRNILIGNKQGNIFIYSLWYKKLLAKVSIHKLPLVDLHWNKKTELVSGSNEKILSYFEIKKKLCKLMNLDNHKINRISISQNKSTLACCSEDCKIPIFSINLNLFHQNFLFEKQKKILTILWEPKKIVQTQKRDFQYLLSCSKDFIIKIWNTQKACCLVTLFEKFPILSINWCATGKYIILCNSSNKVSFFKKNGKKKKENFYRSSTFSEIQIHSMVKRIAFLSKNSIFYY